MANKMIPETVIMPQNDSSCTVWGEWAMVYTDELDNHRGIPWTSISQMPFTMENAQAVCCLDGFIHVAPALYWGIDDNNDAVYCTYKRVP